jgi:lysophospholipid acyltransferase
MPLLNFIVVLALLSVAHFYRQFSKVNIDKYTVEITGPLMMLTIKLTSFAFDIHDAAIWLVRKPIEPSITKINSPEEVPGSERISKFPLVDLATKNQILKRYPSFLEFLGYALLFPGLLTGPVVSFYEYRTFINGSYYTGVDVTEEALPGRKRRALYLFTVAVLFLAIYVGLQDVFPVAHVLDPDFLSHSLLYRLFYVHSASFVSRSKYYFAWMISEGSYVIIGLGFRLSTSRKPLWDRLENVNPLRIETSSDFKVLVAQWNVCTNQWLNSYVYRRIQNYYGKGSSSARASLATYVVSAFWHGFYPGYYFMFVSSAWLTVASRSMFISLLYHTNLLVVYKNVTWPFSSIPRRILLYIPTYLMVDYILYPFTLLDFKRSFQFYRSFGFFGHFILALVTIYFTMVMPNTQRPAQQRGAQCGTSKDSDEKTE